MEEELDRIEREVTEGGYTVYSLFTKMAELVRRERIDTCIGKAGFAACYPNIAKAAQSEPVAEVVSKYGDLESFGERELVALCDLQKVAYGTKLFASPPSAQVLVEALEKVTKQLQIAVHYMQTDKNGLGADCADVFQAIIDGSSALATWRRQNGQE